MSNINTQQQQQQQQHFGSHPWMRSVLSHLKVAADDFYRYNIYLADDSSTKP